MSDPNDLFQSELYTAADRFDAKPSQEAPMGCSQDY